MNHYLVWRNKDQDISNRPTKIWWVDIEGTDKQIGFLLNSENGNPKREIGFSKLIDNVCSESEKALIVQNIETEEKLSIDRKHIKLISHGIVTSSSFTETKTVFPVCRLCKNFTKSIGYECSFRKDNCNPEWDFSNLV